jgi:hypothetical protein
MRDFGYLRVAAFSSVPKPGDCTSRLSGKQGTLADTSSGSRIRWLTGSSFRDDSGPTRRASLRRSADGLAPALTEALSTTLVARRCAPALPIATKTPSRARARETASGVPGGSIVHGLTDCSFRVGSEPSVRAALRRCARAPRPCAARLIVRRGTGNDHRGRLRALCRVAPVTAPMPHTPRARTRAQRHRESTPDRTCPGSTNSRCQAPGATRAARSKTPPRARTRGRECLPPHAPGDGGCNSECSAAPWSRPTPGGCS